MSKMAGDLATTIPYEFETISLPVLSEVGGDIQFIANTDDTAIGGMTMNTGVKQIDMNSLTRVDGTVFLTNKGVEEIYEQKTSCTDDPGRIWIK